MRIRRKFVSYIYISIPLLLVLFVLFIFTDPAQKIIPALPFTFTHLFLVILFLGTSSLFTFIVKKLRLGILIGIFLNGVVILKLLELHRIPYIILLLVVVAGAEFYFRSKNSLKS